jgi:site-specific DNA-methyltransferase (adenine-specific)
MKKGIGFLNTNDCRFLLGDCRKFMKIFKDKEFDIAVVDPPYGIGKFWKKNKTNQCFKDNSNFNNEIPTADYFNELFRISKNQIVFGVNYYWNYFKPSNNLIFWNKGIDTLNCNGSGGELAWTAFKKYPLLVINLMWNGKFTCEPVTKIHPCQKPVMLYDKLFSVYAEKGMKIIDTHLGSGSSAISAYKFGLNFTGIEKEEKYLFDATKRYHSFLNQYSLQL